MRNIKHSGLSEDNQEILEFLVNRTFRENLPFFKLAFVESYKEAKQECGPVKGPLIHIAGDAVFVGCYLAFRAVDLLDRFYEKYLPNHYIFPLKTESP